jgi:predicted DNA binding CopG/RHH family protein
MITSKQLIYIKQQISGLLKDIQDFVLSDMDTMLDIVDNQMGSYEIDTMVGSYLQKNIKPSFDMTFPGVSQKTKPITIRVPTNDLNYLKQQSFSTGM